MSPGTRAPASTHVGASSPTLEPHQLGHFLPHGRHLLLGGIGVMNIMLVSVNERTRRIGVRKAIGARRSNFLMQFLIEAVTLSAVGGVIGVLFGARLTVLLKYGVHMPAQLSLAWIIAALMACATIASGFTLLRKTEALRYE